MKQRKEGKESSVTSGWPVNVTGLVSTSCESRMFTQTDSLHPCNRMIPILIQYLNIKIYSSDHLLYRLTLIDSMYVCLLIYF